MATVLWVVLGWLSLPLLGVLAGVCVWRKTYRDLPLFSSYIAIAFLIGVVRLLVLKLGSGRAYFYVYWYSDFASVVAALLAIYEVFLRRIFPSFYRVRLYRLLFPSALFLIALGAFVAIVGAHDRKAAFAITSHSLDFLRTAVIGFLAALTLIMGRKFSGPEFWIAAGFGVQAAIALIHSALGSYSKPFASLMSWAEFIVYDLVCIAWIGLFSAVPHTDEQPVAFPSATVVVEARSWERMLKEWLFQESATRNPHQQ